MIISETTYDLFTSVQLNAYICIFPFLIGESCIKNETIMFVEPGSDVIIKCICSTETKGGVTGPVISSSIDMGNSDHIPYTDGSVLNLKLDTAKYMVVVNSNKKECNLKIVKFSREENGIYKCQYHIMDKIAIHVYTIAIKSNYILS